MSIQPKTDRVWVQWTISSREHWPHTVLHRYRLRHSWEHRNARDNIAYRDRVHCDDTRVWEILLGRGETKKTTSAKEKVMLKYARSDSYRTFRYRMSLRSDYTHVYPWAAITAISYHVYMVVWTRQTHWARAREIYSMICNTRNINFFHNKNLKVIWDQRER